MLDVSRHYMPVVDIRRLIDAAEICGMNRMHWHLTDDQGWRIEIKKYPLLTQVGAHRKESFFGGVSTTEHNDGFYTQEEIREVVSYAKNHGIEIIPEIEVPGHASAMLTAYPQYGCRRIRYTKASHQIPEDFSYSYSVEIAGGIFPNLLCAGKDEAIRFFEDILDEIVELFPFSMVHIGGDEAEKIHWRRCPDCQKRMRENDIETEDGLQRWLILQIGDYLAKKGKETIVWNDVLAGGMLPSHFVVQQWMGNSPLTREFLAQGGRVICSDTDSYYLDYCYGKIDVRHIYDYPRVPGYATGYEEQILGIECPLWTERVTNVNRAAFLLFPRMAAVGLKALGEEPDDWDIYLDKLREKQEKIAGCGLSGAAEGYWKMSLDDAAIDLVTEKVSICSPDAMPYVTFETDLQLLEKAERLMELIEMPRDYALYAGDLAMEKIYGAREGIEGKQIPVVDEEAEEMIRQLMIAVKNREEGLWKDLPEDIWIDTMKCFTRFVLECKACSGTESFDRGFWTVRQIEARLFRIGELEYELLNTEGESLGKEDGLPDAEDELQIGLHIPSDAKLGAFGLLNESLVQARAFLEKYFPKWKDAPIVCESWLLSPILKKLLPENSNILHFQSAFDITGGDPSDDSVTEWVFKLPGSLRESYQVEDLPENTSLQRSMKQWMAKGGCVGSGYGKLVRTW